MTDTAAVTARGLKKIFNRQSVLDLLDLTIERGEAVGLLGANGAGKTTLLKSLLGLLPVDGGRCTVLGESSSSLSSGVRERLAYVPQSPGQFPWLTGLSMLRYVSSFYPSFDWAYAQDLAARWKLALATQIGVLSPGQQQRLSIVRALATHPELLVLDEPIASLDPATRIAVIDELLSERKRRVITVIFSSHIIGDLERLCSRLAVLAAGKIAVMESVDWFRSRVRVTLDGEESALEQTSIPGVALVRKVGSGRRVAVVERDGVARLVASLPSEIQLKTDEMDVEALTSEWMQ